MRPRRLPALEALDVSFRATLLGLAIPFVLLAAATPAIPSEGADLTQVPCTDVYLGSVQCPDLIVDPVKLNDQQTTTQTFTSSSCAVQENSTVPGVRTLLRFYQSTPNIGLGDLIVGNPSQHPEWFVYAPCHRHYHFVEYADYRLWTPDQYAQWKVIKTQNPNALSKDLLAAHPELQPIKSDKKGFCVIDIFPYAPIKHPLGQYGSCSTNQGISTGWADEYSTGLDGQWFDVTNVPNGLYVIESEVNAEHLYVETNYANNDAAAPALILH
jgi:hypothetical protein